MWAGEKENSSIVDFLEKTHMTVIFKDETQNYLKKVVQSLQKILQKGSALYKA